MKTTVKVKAWNEGIVGWKNLPVVLVMALLGLVYIWNAQQAERKLIEIHQLEKSVQEKRWEYTSLKKEFMEKASPSRLEKDLEGKVVFPKKGPRILKASKS
jgi:hypothetical protein